MNPDKFHQRKKLFSDLLYEIFNVESNYRTELSVLNLKLLRKIEYHKNKILQKKQDKFRQTLVPSNTIKITEKQNTVKKTLILNKSTDDILSDKEENPLVDKLMSEGLQNLLTFYKTKHKLISKEVSNLGIIIYNFSSSQKKHDNNEDFNIITKYQNDFDINFAKFMKSKKKYFEKMNNLELLFQEEEEKNKNKQKNESETNKQEKEKIDELIELRQKYKKYLTRLTRDQKTYIAKINEIGNEIQEFNITENNILYDIFKIFEQKLKSLLIEVNNYSIFYEHNKKIIQDLNIELGNNLIYDDRIYINYKFEEYSPKFIDINNQKDLAVIQKMNKLIGFEFDKIKTNHENNDIKLPDNIIYNKDIDDNLLFILLMDKFINGESLLNEKEKNLMKDLFKQEKYIKEFLNKLNKIRSNKKLFSTKAKFDILLDFFNVIYSKVPFSDNKSHELIKFLFILSETFFYKDGEEKIFLNNVINNPDEVKEAQFWIKYIELEIKIESKKYENTKNARYEYIVLLSNTTHLKECFLEKETMIEILEYFKNKYKFTIEENEILKEQLNI